MPKKQIVIYEPNKRMIDMIISSWGEAEDLKFTYEIFTEADLFEKYFKHKEDVDLWLIDHTLYGECKIQKPEEKVIEFSVELKEDSIFKYQPVDEIVRSIEFHLGVLKIENETNYKLISFYSPFRNSLEDSAFRFASKVAKWGKTVYINLQPFSYLEEFKDHTIRKDVVDLIYQANMEDNLFVLEYPKNVLQRDELEVIAPVYNPVNMLEVSREQIERFIKIISANFKYEYIVLALSNSVQGLFELLENSDRIFSVKSDTVREKEIYNHFTAIIDDKHQGGIEERLLFIEDVEFSERNMEGLIL